MKRIKNIGSIPGIIAFVFAMFVAFAFTRPSGEIKPAAKGMPPAQIWIKYDCGNANQVYTVVPNTLDGALTPNTGLFAKCTGNLNICAIRYVYGDTEPVGGNEDIRKPKAGKTGNLTARCVTNTTP